MPSLIYIYIPLTLRFSYISNEASLDVNDEDIPCCDEDYSHFHFEFPFNDDGNVAHVAHVDENPGDFTQDISHGGYVCPSDTVFNNALDIHVPDASPPRSLFDCKHSIESWCSDILSAGLVTPVGFVHQYVSDSDDYRTQDPVFTHSSLTKQSNGPGQIPELQPEPCHVSPHLTERRRRPQVVRDWLSSHRTWPYPTPTEKLGLITATGYTEEELNNCLTNLRAREKDCKSHVKYVVIGSTDVEFSIA